MNLQFLIIDPQNDFAHPDGHLFIPGADKDSERLATLLKRHLSQIDEIYVTVDTHHWVDIAHPIFWVDRQGQSPAPFTIITENDVLEGHWQTRQPEYQARATDYVKTLAAHGRYELTIWPPHCLMGHWGHNVVAPIIQTLTEWENTFAMVDYVMKGTNLWTEHYSAIIADVPDPNDPCTLLNTTLLEQLKQADLIVCSGQALSHCVANTLRDIATHFDEGDMSRFALVEDTTSPVPGFEELGQQFLVEMQAQGMRLVKSSEFLV